MATTFQKHLSAARSAYTGDTLQLLNLINILKVSINAADQQGITLLHWAAANDHLAVAEMLLRHVYVLNFISLFFKI